MSCHVEVHETNVNDIELFLFYLLFLEIIFLIAFNQLKFVSINESLLGKP